MGNSRGKVEEQEEDLENNEDDKATIILDLDGLIQEEAKENSSPGPTFKLEFSGPEGDGKFDLKTGEKDIDAIFDQTFDSDGEREETNTDVEVDTGMDGGNEEVPEFSLSQDPKMGKKVEVEDQSDLLEFDLSFDGEQDSPADDNHEETNEDDVKTAANQEVDDFDLGLDEENVNGPEVGAENNVEHQASNDIEMNAEDGNVDFELGLDDSGAGETENEMAEEQGPSSTLQAPELDANGDDELDLEVAGKSKFAPPPQVDFVDNEDSLEFERASSAGGEPSTALEGVDEEAENKEKIATPKAEFTATFEFNKPVVESLDEAENPSDPDFDSQAEEPEALEGEDIAPNEFREFSVSPRGLKSRPDPKIPEGLEGLNDDEVEEDEGFDENKGIEDEKSSATQMFNVSSLGTLDETAEDGEDNAPIKREPFVGSGPSVENLEQASRDYLNYHENELIKLSAIIRNLREDRAQLLEKIERLEEEKVTAARNSLSLKAELDDVKIELALMKKRDLDDLEGLKYQLKIGQNKREILEQQNKNFQKEFERLQQRVKIDFRKVKEREKELENQLELLKTDAQMQINTREQKILELKRQVDAMEFDMENMVFNDRKIRERQMQLEDKLSRALKIMKTGVSLLEKEDMEVENTNLIKKIKF